MPENDVLTIKDAEDLLEATTQSIFTTPEELLGYYGVAVYDMEEDGSLTPAEYAVNSSPYVFYEVEGYAEGSWWIPTSTRADPQWNEDEPLNATGNINSDGALRPSRQFWWIPANAFTPYISVLTVLGRVKGAVPDLPPQYSETGKKQKI